jgi:hypothetical protein
MVVMVCSNYFIEQYLAIFGPKFARSLRDADYRGATVPTVRVAPGFILLVCVFTETRHFANTLYVV